MNIFGTENREIRTSELTWYFFVAYSLCKHTSNRISYGYRQVRKKAKDLFIKFNFVFR